jgi:tetratricopeptide (TPR) repeat protein
MSYLRHGCLALLASLTLGASTQTQAAELTVLEAGSAAQLTALGNEALMQGRYETAIEHYRRALGVDKTSFQALFNLALAHQHLGKDNEARRWYEEALKISHDHPEVLCNLGFLAFRAGEWRDAEEKFLDAARQAAGSTAAADHWFNVGAAREHLKLWHEARRAYEECLALDATHFGGHYNLGTLYLSALSDQPQALDKAESALSKARDLAPARAEAWVNLALCHERQGRGDPNAEFDQAVKVANPSYLPHALFARARFHDRASPPRRLAMRDDLKTLLAIDPHYPQANGLLGGYHFAIGEYEPAIQLLTREVDGEHFDPSSAIDVESHYLLAIIYTDQRPDPSKALSHATDYYQLRPDSAKIQDLRRRALRLGGGKQAGDKRALDKDTKGSAAQPISGANATHGAAGHAAPAHGTAAHSEPAAPSAHAGHGTSDPHAAPAAKPAHAGDGAHSAPTKPAAPAGKSDHPSDHH